MDLVELNKQREGIYIGVLIEDALMYALKEAKKLRDSLVYFEPKIKSLKAHLKAADKGNFKKVLIIGEEELKNKTFFEKEL